MPYSPEHKGGTRERILRSARQLFNRKGFSEVTIDEIMAAAGLTRGGFYNHFHGKEELSMPRPSPNSFTAIRPSNGRSSTSIPRRAVNRSPA